MHNHNRTQLVLGVILILIAGWLIATRADPRLAQLIRPARLRYLALLGHPDRGRLLVLGLLVGAPGMPSRPAFRRHRRHPVLPERHRELGLWAYMWTLIPGFAGVGSLLAGLLGDDTRSSLRHGLNSVVVSVILFAIFRSFFGAWAIFGVYSAYLPIALLVLAGIWLIVRASLRR